MYLLQGAPTVLKTDFLSNFFPLSSSDLGGWLFHPPGCCAIFIIVEHLCCSTACQEAVKLPDPSAWRVFVSAPQFLSEEYVCLKWKKTTAFRIQGNMW